jgi:hypothetical protein
MNVPNGTPVTVATVRPVNIKAMALARRSSGTRFAAIVEPMDIKTPWDRAEITLATSKIPKLVAVAARLFPITNTIMIHIRSDFLDIDEVREVKIGAPKATPKA